MAYYLALVKGSGKSKGKTNNAAEKDAQESGQTGLEKKRAMKKMDEGEPGLDDDPKKAKKVKKMDEEEPGLDEAPTDKKEKKSKKEKAMDGEECGPKDKKEKKSKKEKGIEEEELGLDEAPKDKNEKKQKKEKPIEEEELGLDEAPKDKKEKKQKKNKVIEEEELGLDEAPKKEKKQKKEKVIGEEELGLDETPKDKKEKKQKKEKAIEDEELGLDEAPKNEKTSKKDKKTRDHEGQEDVVTDNEKKPKMKKVDEDETGLDEAPKRSNKEKKTRKEPVGSEPKPSSSMSPDVRMREVVDLNSPEEEDSQLDTPKRMALNLMRPEDWERIKKRQEHPDGEEEPYEDTIADEESDSEKNVAGETDSEKKRKPTWEDLPPRKKMTGTVGPDKFVRLNTSTSRDSLDTENYVTPDKPTKKPKSPSAVPPQSFLDCTFWYLHGNVSCYFAGSCMCAVLTFTTMGYYGCHSYNVIMYIYN